MSSTITEKELRYFIDAVTYYFTQSVKSNITVLPAYLANNKDLPKTEYIGIINVSGHFSGQLCFAATKAMLNSLLLSMGEPINNEDARLDLVGELANIFSGNVRKQFGDKFIISVPEKGADREVKLNEELKSYIIPILWEHKTAYIIVRIEKEFF